MSDRGKQQKSLMSEVEGREKKGYSLSREHKKKEKGQNFFPLSPCPGCRTGCVGFKSTFIFFNGNG